MAFSKPQVTIDLEEYQELIKTSVFNSETDVKKIADIFATVLLTIKDRENGGRVAGFIENTLLNNGIELKGAVNGFEIQNLSYKLLNG